MGRNDFVVPFNKCIDTDLSFVSPELTELMQVRDKKLFGVEHINLVLYPNERSERVRRREHLIDGDNNRLSAGVEVGLALSHYCFPWSGCYMNACVTNLEIAAPASGRVSDGESVMHDFDVWQRNCQLGTTRCCSIAPTNLVPLDSD